MDLTPPSLTTSPASPQDQGFDSPPLLNSTLGNQAEAVAASYPSPDLLDYPFKTISPYLTNNALPGSQDVWGSPNSMTSSTHVSLAPTMNNGLPTSEYDNFPSYDPSLTGQFCEGYPVPSSGAASDAHLMRAVTPISRPASTTTPSTALGSRSSFGYLHSHLMQPSKMDSLPPYGQGLEAQHFPSVGIPPLPFPTNETTFPGSPDPYYEADGIAMWSEKESRQPQLEASSSKQPEVTSAIQTPPQTLRRGENTQRRQRRRTTREEANFQCTVQGCGKFFSRSYNFKSHMETHDDKREYPFPCPLDGCTKKFVRKTDLQRHHQSVHMKERNHKCDFCGRLFARKDTLRR